MTDRIIADTHTVSSLLARSEQDVAHFVQRCVRSRSLSSVITALNSELLFGTEEESDKARRALEHIGFI